MTDRPVIENIKPAGPEHRVIRFTGGGGGHMSAPCPTCPWLQANDGLFPPEAFIHAAPTAYDMADTEFSCHTAGLDHPRVCAGYLLRGSTHNLAARLRIATRGPRPVQEVPGLHANYKAMSVANGVPENHPVLRPIREDV